MEKQENKNENIEINLSEQELNTLYYYLNMSIDSMSDEEKVVWFQLMEKIDKNFHDS